MQKYAPQSLPIGAARKAAGQRMEGAARNPSKENTIQRQNPAMYAIQLGQYIRRERGMMGVRSFVSAMRDFLPQQDFNALCKTMGVTYIPPKQEAINKGQTKGEQNKKQDKQKNSAANQLQMMQMMSQLMNMQNGGMNGGINTDGANGGINPAMLAQLLGGMNGK